MQSSLFICSKHLFKFLVFSLVILHTSILFAQKTEVDSILTKTITVKEILMSTERSKGLSGVKLTLLLDDMIVKDDSLRVKYTLNSDSYTRQFVELNPKSIDRIEIFHPFALLFYNAGTHHVSFMLDQFVDIAKQTKYVIEGIKEQATNVVVPTMHTMQVKVNYTEVTPKTPKGKAWDFYLFPRTKSDKYPDLIYTVEAAFNEASRGIFGGQFYRAHKQKNTLIASWPYLSDSILYCEGDELSLCVKDADVIFHDKIGCISIHELILQENTEQLHFGSVLKFSYELIVK